MITQTTQKPLLTLLLKTFSVSAHIVGFLIFLLVVLVLLIGVYHTSIFLIAHALPALFKFFIPTVTLALATGVIFLKHPVHSLLCLISVFFSTVLLFVYVGAEFLAFLFLIVYVGAIAILFLFVIMLLHLKELSSVAWTTAGGAAVLFFPTVLLTVCGMDDLVSQALSSFFSNSDALRFNTENTSVESLTWFVNNQFLDILTFSALLYTYYSFLFFLVSLLLLTAMLGAIILATSATDLDAADIQDLNDSLSAPFKVH